MNNDYPYVGMDFRDDPKLVLPEHEVWGASSKKFQPF